MQLDSYQIDTLHELVSDEIRKIESGETSYGDPQRDADELETLNDIKAILRSELAAG